MIISFAWASGRSVKIFGLGQHAIIFWWSFHIVTVWKWELQVHGAGLAMTPLSDSDLEQLVPNMIPIDASLLPSVFPGAWVDLELPWALGEISTWSWMEQEKNQGTSSHSVQSNWQEKCWSYSRWPYLSCACLAGQQTFSYVSGFGSFFLWLCREILETKQQSE